MQDNKKIMAPTKEAFYKILNIKLEGMLSSEKDSLANLCNSAAHLYSNMECINWAGYYIIREGELVLGPFCGKPACSRLTLGKGVCGTAAETKEPQVVPDVHQFPGHVACDDASQSEIVIPIIKEYKVIGVLDIDSPEKNTFDDEDRIYLEKFVEKLNRYIDWKRI